MQRPACTWAASQRFTARRARQAHVISSATSAPGLGPPLQHPRHPHRNWDHPFHYLHPDWAHPRPHLHAGRDWVPERKARRFPPRQRQAAQGTEERCNARPHTRPRGNAAGGTPGVRRDWAHPCLICTGTGLAPATSAPELGSPLPHLHRDCARKHAAVPAGTRRRGASTQTCTAFSFLPSCGSPGEPCRDRGACSGVAHAHGQARAHSWARGLCGRFIHPRLMVRTRPLGPPIRPA